MLGRLFNFFKPNVLFQVMVTSIATCGDEVIYHKFDVLAKNKNHYSKVSKRKIGSGTPENIKQMEKPKKLALTFK
jgi:hypothetical protein